MRISDETRKKLIASAVVFVVAVLAATSAMDFAIEKTFAGKLDEAGKTYLNETLERSVYTFAVARGINGVISVIQGTNIAVSPAGIGVNLAIGEILDPVNDLVERFSWVMLLSLTSVGLQRVLMEISMWFGFKVLLSGGLVFILAGLWYPKALGIDLKSIGYKLALAAVIIRFCIPAVALAGDGIYALFLEKEYNDAIRSLEDVNRELEKSAITEDRQPAGDGYLEKLRKMYDSSVEAFEYKEKLEFLKEKLSEYTKYIINLIVVFVIQTIIIPIVSLWALAKLAGWIFGRNFSPEIGGG